MRIEEKYLDKEIEPKKNKLKGHSDDGFFELCRKKVLDDLLKDEDSKMDFYDFWSWCLDVGDDSIVELVFHDFEDDNLKKDSHVKAFYEIYANLKDEAKKDKDAFVKEYSGGFESKMKKKFPNSFEKLKESIQSKNIAGLSDEELMLNLSEILWEFTNDRERWDHTSRLGYVDDEGWNTVVRDKFGTKCFRLAFGNNGGSQTENNKWEDYLEDISNFVVEYEQRVREVFGPKANVWIINIVFDVADDVYDLVCGVSVGEEFDYFESDEMKEKLLPPEFLYGEGRKPSEKEIEDYKKLLGPSYDESMDPFVEGWIH